MAGCAYARAQLKLKSFWEGSARSCTSGFSAARQANEEGDGVVCSRTGPLRREPAVGRSTVVAIGEPAFTGIFRCRFDDPQVSNTPGAVSMTHGSATCRWPF